VNYAYKDNYWSILAVINEGDIIYYNSSYPMSDEMIEFFRSHNVNVVKSNKRPDDYVYIRNQESDFIGDEPTYEWNRKLYIDSTCEEAVRSLAREGDKFYSKTLIADGVIKTDERPQGLLLLVELENLNSHFEYISVEGLLQYVPTIPVKSVYRRSQVHKFFKTTWIQGGQLPSDPTKVTAVIFSDGRRSEALARWCIRNKIRIIYDRSDNWNAMSPGCEDYLLENADVITTSAKSMSLGTYIPNGFNWLSYEKKEHVKSICYVGQHIQKVDFDFINDLAKNNPNWLIKIIGLRDIKSTRPNVIFYGHLEEEMMMNVIADCTAGLIAHKENDYTKDQLTLKAYNYAMDDKAILIAGNSNTNMDHLGAIHIDSKFNLDTLPKTTHVEIDEYEWPFIIEQLRETWKC